MTSPAGADPRYWPDEQRFRTLGPDRRTLHSFSFGSHYDPANLGFAAMVAANDEQLGPTGGYGTHPHSGLEIITVVLDGTLAHTDSLAPEPRYLDAGSILRLRSGRGIQHSEYAAGEQPARFLQTWLRPDQPDVDPEALIMAGPGSGELTVVAGPQGLPLDVRGAALAVGTDLTSAVTLPDQASLFVFVATGQARYDSLLLRTGDTLRLLPGPNRGSGIVQPDPAMTLVVWSFRGLRGTPSGPPH